MHILASTFCLVKLYSLVKTKIFPSRALNLKMSSDTFDYVLYITFLELSKAQRSFSKLLTEFEFECIGTEKTDDEILIGEPIDPPQQSHFHCFVPLPREISE